MSIDRPRLWDSEHPYYCNDSNYFKNGVNMRFDSVEDMLEEWGDADEDYNALFRWDWREDEYEYVDVENGDEPGEMVCLYFVLQRKGFLKPVMAPIDKARREEQEEALYDFISKRWEHTKSLWAPFACGE